VICPAGQTAPLQRAKPGSMAYFGAACASCPASRAVHQRQGRTHRLRRPLRRPTRPRPSPATRPGLESRLSRHPTQGRTQDRPPDPPTPRRAPCPRPQPNQDRRRLRTTRRRRQPRQTRRARTAHPPLPDGPSNPPAEPRRLQHAPVNTKHQTGTHVGLQAPPPTLTNTGHESPASPVTTASTCICKGRSTPAT
jgi:hypothetical protein